MVSKRLPQMMCFLLKYFEAKQNWQNGQSEYKINQKKMILFRNLNSSFSKYFFRLITFCQNKILFILFLHSKLQPKRDINLPNNTPMQQYSLKESFNNFGYWNTLAVDHSLLIFSEAIDLTFSADYNKIVMPHTICTFPFLSINTDVFVTFIKAWLG